MLEIAEGLGAIYSRGLRGTRERNKSGDQITARQGLNGGFEEVGNLGLDRRLHLQHLIDLIWTEARECNGMAHGCSPAAESTFSDPSSR